jgi:hypothetical protein
LKKKKKEMGLERMVLDWSGGLPGSLVCGSCLDRNVI